MKKDNTSHVQHHLTFAPVPTVPSRNSGDVSVKIWRVSLWTFSHANSAVCGPRSGTREELVMCLRETAAFHHLIRSLVALHTLSIYTRQKPGSMTFAAWVSDFELEGEEDIRAACIHEAKHPRSTALLLAGCLHLHLNCGGARALVLDMCLLFAHPRWRPCLWVIGDP